MNYINDEIIIDFPLPKGFDYLIAQCEKFDEEDNYGGYENFANFLTSVACRDAYAVGKLTKEQWDLFERKYAL